MNGNTPMYGSVRFYKRPERVGSPGSVIVRSDDGPIKSRIGNWKKTPIEALGLNREDSDGYRRDKAAVPIEGDALERIKRGYSSIFSMYFDPEEFFEPSQNPYYPGTLIRIQPGYLQKSSSDMALYVESRVPNSQPKEQKPRKNLVEGIGRLVDRILR